MSYTNTFIRVAEDCPEETGIPRCLVVHSRLLM